MYKVIGFILMGAGFCANGVGQAPVASAIDPPPQTETQAVRRQASPALQITAGDLLQVRVFDTPELSGPLRVSQAGSVRLPVGGDVYVAGLTPEAAANRIEERLRSEHLMLDPHVQVSVGEFATTGVTVLGEVKSPGNYPLLGTHTLPDVIAAAGGLTVSAGDTAVVSHADDLSHPIVVTALHAPDFAANNVLLQPGDRVTITKAGIVYVLGAVGRAGGFVIEPNGGLTILQALSLAQGFTQVAAQRKAVIIRKDTGQVERIGSNLQKIVDGTAPDQQMHSGDVLYIPPSLGKTLTYRGIEAAIAIGTGFAIYRQ